MSTKEAKLYEIDRSEYLFSRYRKLRRYVDPNGNESSETYERITFPLQDSDKYYEVPPGEENMLDLIASKEDFLNNENLWWVIAEASDIMDPFDVPVGTVLRIPALSSLYGFKGALS